MRTLLAFLVLVAGGAMAQQPGPRVLIIYDMEGVSGITRQEFTSVAFPAEYAKGRELLTADVNAAIKGLKAGGAGPILVQDGHGSGNSAEPDVLLDKMDPAATMDFRAYDFDPYSTGLNGSFAAIVCVGMHARAGTQGFLAHTFNGTVSMTVNGAEFTETHIIAASAARWGTPVIMVSGDDVLGPQLAPDFPELEYAAGKIAKSHALAEPLPERLSSIEAAAKRGMQKFIAGKFKPYYMEPPFHFQLGFKTREQADGAERSPMAERASDLSVRYTAATFVDGYEQFKHVLPLSNDSYWILVRLLKQDAAGKKYLDQWREVLRTRFADGTAPAWALPPPPEPQPKRFYGDN